MRAATLWLQRINTYYNVVPICTHLIAFVRSICHNVVPSRYLEVTTCYNTAQYCTSMYPQRCTLEIQHGPTLYPRGYNFVPSTYLNVVWQIQYRAISCTHIPTISYQDFTKVVTTEHSPGQKRSVATISMFSWTQKIPAPNHFSIVWKCRHQEMRQIGTMSCLHGGSSNGEARIQM